MDMLDSKLIALLEHWHKFKDIHFSSNYFSFFPTTFKEQQEL